MDKKMCVIGLGYIGLPTATIFSLSGYKVIGVDINETVLEKLHKESIIVEEPKLQTLVKYAIKNNNLTVCLEPEESDIFIIAVPTPIKENKTADMKYVVSAARSIVKYLKKGNIVILESTSPVGTTEEILKPIIEESGLKVGSDLLLGYCPERVIPGDIINELKRNNRLIGGINELSAIEIEKIYKSFVEGEIYLTDCKTAEICKLMENIYRDVNIALANELLLICDNLEINGWKVIEYCNKHPRVNLHTPGPGVGGHCLSVDPWFVVEKEPQLSKLIKTSRQINDNMPTYVYETIEKILDFEKNKKITILGITYKANISDIRESSIIKLIDILLKNNYNVSVYDPFVKDSYLSKDNIIEACEDSDLVVLGVDHDEFKNIPLDMIKKVMSGNILLDTRNFFNKEEVLEVGLDYRLLGL